MWGLGNLNQALEETLENGWGDMINDDPDRKRLMILILNREITNPICSSFQEYIDSNIVVSVIAVGNAYAQYRSGTTLWFACMENLGMK